jgi:hypothetical protein
MQLLLKLLISLLIITIESEIGKKFPTLSGLIATMPLTTLIVMFWIYYENNGNCTLLTKYTTGVIFGIIPSMIFFIVFYISLTKGFTFYLSLLLSFFTWLTFAFIHQFFLK